jgi:hypothetical protein
MQREELIEALGSFAADLLSESRKERFVHALVSAQGGLWHRVADLTLLPASLAVVRSEFFVTALPMPGSSADPAYRTLVFLCREPWYDMVATYNTGRLAPRKLSLMDNDADI